MIKASFQGMTSLILFISTGLLSGCINADRDGTAVFSGPAGIILK